MNYTINLRTRNQSTGVLSTTNITNYVVNAFSIIEKLDESLDVGSMTLRGLNSDTPYTMFDTIEILIGTTKLYSQKIAGDVVTLMSKSPLLYQHTLTLVEHTKILERFIISGKTFTQPTSTTTRYYLYDVLDDLINTTPLEMSDMLSTTRVCKLPTSGTLYTFLTTTESPEFTFKDITLREAFNQVGSYFNSIARLELNSSDELELTFDNVNDLQTLITSENDFIKKEVRQDIDLYATNLESEVLNSVNNSIKENIVEIFPANGGYVSLRSESFVFDFDKSFIPTPKNIYKLEKVLVKMEATVFNGATLTYIKGSSTSTEVFDVDISPRIVEWNTYRTLPYGILTQDLTKQSTIFYEDRTKNIRTGITFGIFDTKIDLEHVIKESVIYWLIQDGTITESTTGDITTTITTLYEDLVFQVHYIPIPKSLRYNIDKADNTDVKYNSTLLSNQQSRIVNTERFTNNMHAKINRIGNSELELSNRVNDIDDLYSIGDYTDDLYIITDKELIFYKDYIYANYHLSRDFNMISKFIGVDSEYRQWEIGEKNLLDRNLMYREYIEIDVVESTGVGGSNDSELLTSNGINTFLNTFYSSSTDKPVRGALMVGDDIVSSDGTTLKTVVVPISSNGGGNSLIFNWKFENNKYISNFRETVTISGSSQLANNFAQYTNNDGLSENFTIYMIDELDTGDTTMADYLTSGDNYPYASLSDIKTTLLVNTSKFQMYKDVREVIGQTIHLQMKSLSPSVLGIGRALSTKNRLVSENPPSSYKLYTYDDGIKFTRTDTSKALSGYNAVQTITPSVFLTGMYVTVAGTDLDSSTSSYCITDEDDNILFYVNQSGTLLNKFKFDFLNKSSKLYYKY